MVDLRRLGGVLGGFLTRVVQSGLAILVLLSLWLMGEIPSGPNAPEQAGTFTWAFLFSWGFASAFLLTIIVGHILFRSHRMWSAGAFSELRSSASRIATESILGLLIMGFQITSTEVSPVLAAPALIAWTVLIHHSVGLIQFSRVAIQSE